LEARTVMTVQEFDAGGNATPCRDCSRPGMMRRHVINGNQERVVCPHCGSGKPWGSIVNLKHNGRPTRKGTPFGEDLEDVWARFDNRCVVCSRTKDELTELGVSRERQHVAPYASHEHRGPLVPICTRCHQIATVLQKDAAVMRGFIRQSRTHAEPLSDRRPAVSDARLSPDPVRPSRQTPFGALEGFPDDDADG